MLRAIIFFGLATSAFASATLDVLVNAAASFSATISEVQKARVESIVLKKSKRDSTRNPMGSTSPFVSRRREASGNSGPRIRAGRSRSLHGTASAFCCPVERPFRGALSSGRRIVGPKSLLSPRNQSSLCLGRFQNSRRLRTRSVN
jgi:hypothetical protein